MPRKTTFGKEQIQELIQKLKDQGVKSTSFHNLINDMDNLIPEHNHTRQQLEKALSYWKRLFKDADIEIYSHKDKIRDEGIQYIKKGLLYFKNELGQTVVNGKEFANYLKNEFNFNLHRNPASEKRYMLKELMEEYGMSFLTNEKRRNKTLDILKDFSKSDIVKKYKKEEKKFTIPKLHDELKDKVSISSLYNYSVEIVQLGIPLTTNKVIK